MLNKKKSMWATIKLVSGIIAGSAAVVTAIAVYMEKKESLDKEHAKEVETQNHRGKVSKNQDLILEKLESLGLPSPKAEEFLFNLLGENYLEILENDESRNNLIRNLDNKSLYQILEERNEFNKMIQVFGKTEVDKEILDQAFNLFKTFQYESMLTFIDDYINTNQNLNASSISQLHNIKAVAYDKLFDFNSAISELEKAIVYDNENIGLYNFLGNIYLSKKDYEKSKEAFLAAIEIPNEEKALNKELVAELYVGLARCDQYFGDYGSAVKYLNKSLTISENIKDKRGESLSLMRLAEVHIDMNEYNKALELNEKADSIIKELSENKYADLAIQYNYGRIHLYLKDYEKASSAIKNALQLSIETDGLDNPTIGAIFLVRGDIYRAQSKIDKAFEDYEKAKSLFLQHFGEYYLALDDVYNRMGMIYSNQGNYAEAKINFEKSLNIVIKKLPSNHIKLVERYHSLGRVFFENEKYQLAKENFEKAIKINPLTYEPNNIWYAQSLFYYGLILVKEEYRQESIQIFLESEEVLLSIDETNYNSQIANINNFIGASYFQLGNIKMARKYWSKTLKILKRLYPMDDFRIKEVQANLNAIKNN